MERNSNAYLAHHGILGQRWGIRRFQKKDGTYTDAGKKRRRLADGTLTPYGKSELDRELRKAKQKLNPSSLSEKTDKLNELADDISKDYDALYKSLSTNTKFKKACADYIKEQRRLGFFDEDTLDMDVYETVDSVLPKFIPSSLLEKQSKFDSYRDDYWNELYSYSTDLIERYKDAKVSMFNGLYKDSAEHYIKNFEWDSNQSWNAYLGRHFEDYWINDLDSRYDLYASVIDFDSRYN